MMVQKNKLKITIILLVTVFFLAKSSPLVAQDTQIKGRVTIWNNIPLENLSISAQKSKQKTKSNNKGEFEIKIDKKNRLLFSADGFINKKVKVKSGDKNLHVEMDLISNNQSNDNELYNDGFKYIPKQYRATAISKIKVEQEKELAGYHSVWDMIRGRCPGVVVNDNKVYIREAISGNISGESQPATIVINGVTVSPSSVDDLDPQNIISINLLKGVAAAVYGGSGANGVVVIKTK